MDTNGSISEPEDVGEAPSIEESKDSYREEFEADSEVDTNGTSLNDFSSISIYSDSDLDSDKTLSSLKSSDGSQSKHESENNRELVEILPEPRVRLHQSQERARFLIRNGEKDAAVTEYIRCLALARIVYGEKHWCLAQAHMILAESYLDLKNLVYQALDHAETAKKIILLWKKPPLAPQKRRKFLYVLVNIYLLLGRTRAALNEFGIADKHLDRARKLSLIYIESVGDSRKAKTLRCKICTPIAKLLFDKQMYDEAIVEYKEALNLLEKLGRGNTIVMVSIRQYLGRCYQEMKEYSDAEEQFNLAINLSEKVLGFETGSEAFIESTLLLARNFSLMNTNSAKEVAENILRNVIVEISSAKTYHYDLDMRANDMLFSILIASGREREAKELLRRILPKKCELFGQASSEVILTLRLLGSLCLTLDEPETAAKYLRKSYDRELILYGGNHSRVKNTKLALDLKFFGICEISCFESIVDCSRATQICASLNSKDIFKIVYENKEKINPKMALNNTKIVVTLLSAKENELSMSIKLGTMCVVNGCENTTEYESNLTFHRFPTHRPELSQKWMKIVNREGFLPSRAMIVCSEHFPDDSFQMRSGKRILKANATPIIPPKIKNDQLIENENSAAVRIFVENNQLEEVSVNDEIAPTLVDCERGLPIQAAVEPTVFLIHSYAHTNTETENLNPTLEGLELSNIELRELLTSDKEIIPRPKPPATETKESLSLIVNWHYPFFSSLPLEPKVLFSL
uniref:THAP-type domain-containing protein n=1 Tax=Strigamia maritima TaxID=126957 RepID=T1JHS7_STRMM